MTIPASPQPVGDGHYRADVAIIGAGLAGLYAAIELPDGMDVIVLDKGRLGGRSGSSSWAQGGMAAALGPDDSPELHLADTAAAGDGLVDHAAAWVLATETPERTRHVMELGADFDTDEDGNLHLAREGGQAVARSVHAADATGAELIRVVREAAAPKVARLEAHAIALARNDQGPVCGVWALADGELVLVQARTVLLATGGCGGLFDATTNQDGATGDGVAMAYRAGAAVRDMEFVQFHPTGLAVEGNWRFLLTEALRGAGATLHATDGTRFMVDIHEDAELAPRHVVAEAILGQPGGQALLDATSIGREAMAEEFPTVLAGAADHGFDLLRERVPVTPAAHYMMGGVRTDLWGRTSLAGLYAAGEVASTGLHGANRMAGNSLAEALVFGGRAGAAMAADARILQPEEAGDPPTLATDPVSGLDELRARLRTLVSDGAGPVRDGDGLAAMEDALAELASELGMPAMNHPGMHSDPVVSELRLACVTAGLIRTNALARTESRGGHIRRDHPETLPTWADRHLERILTP